MSDHGTSVTLIFYKISADSWYKEPALNLLAAAAQLSSYTHVEIAVGEDPGSNGMMRNVCRVYNDNVGVELCERTGKNPQNTYLSLGCSKVQEQKMLSFARGQVGKPFSNSAMARSVFFPRQTTGRSYFCAELVAAILKHGGMMSSDSNPAAATPYSLFKLYSKQAAATANPYALRQPSALNFQTLGMRATHMPAAPQIPLALATTFAAASERHIGGSQRRRSDSPPRASFRLLSAPAPPPGHATLTLSLTSLRG